MKAIFFLICLLPLSVFAAWDAEIALGIDGETWKIKQSKFEDGKENKLDMGNYLVKMTMKKSPEPNGIDVAYTIEEKKGEKFILINKGEETIESKPSSEIYAKGEPGKPHSIITIKIKK